MGGFFVRVQATTLKEKKSEEKNTFLKSGYDIRVGICLGNKGNLCIGAQALRNFSNGHVRKPKLKTYN